MSTYESLLIAYGTSPEQARFLAWDQERAWLANREHPNYGRQDDADWRAFVAVTSGEQE